MESQKTGIESQTELLPFQEARIARFGDDIKDTMMIRIGNWGWIAIGAILGLGFSLRPAIAQLPLVATPTPPATQPTDLPPVPNTTLADSEAEQSEVKPAKSEFEKQGAIVYRTLGDQKLKCDVYVPEGPGPFPAILAIHGGAWRQGSKFALLRHAWKMAQAGYVVVAINYRHAPEFPFPAQIHDCKHAVRWMRANAATYKIDPARIGGFGYSAGGHLVTLLGTTDADDGLEGKIEPGLEKYSSRIKVVAAGGAPCEFSWIDDDSRVLNYWLGGTKQQKPEAYRAASATTYVSKDDPPVYLFHGEYDMLVPVESAKTMYECLTKAGVASHFDVASGGHLMTFSDLRWMDKAIEFFDAQLKLPPDHPASQQN